MGGDSQRKRINGHMAVPLGLSAIHMQCVLKMVKSSHKMFVAMTVAYVVTGESKNAHAQRPFRCLLH